MRDVGGGRVVTDHWAHRRVGAQVGEDAVEQVVGLLLRVQRGFGVRGRCRDQRQGRSRRRRRRDLAGRAAARSEHGRRQRGGAENDRSS